MMPHEIDRSFHGRPFSVRGQDGWVIVTAVAATATELRRLLAHVPGTAGARDAF
jgi:hypothetical protein